MNAEKLFKEMLKGLDRGDFNSIVEKLGELLTVLSDFEASKHLSAMILKEYTTYKSGYLASLMSTIIQRRPELAQVNHPENFLFKLCIVTGSKELYECYIEEAVMPFLEEKEDDEKSEYYLDLLGIAIQYTDLFFPKYVQCIKGMDYNGAFSKADNYPNAVLINREDYETMEDVVEKYNQIVGRRNIIEDLEKRD